MTPEKIQLLQSISSISSNLRQLTSAATTQTEAPCNSTPIANLQLPIDIKQVQKELRKRPISTVIVNSISSAFLEHAQRLAKVVKDHYYQVLQQISSTSPSREFSQELVGLFQVNFEKYLKKLEKVLFEGVDSRVTRFQADADTSSSEDESSTGGGHSQTAITILEYAYLRCQNISPAEKNELAKLTGLQPRQVTIWYQNRRNRKVKNPKTPCATIQSKHQSSSPTSSPGPPGNLDRKRKNASLNQNDKFNSLTHSSDRPFEKRQRTGGPQDEEHDGYRTISSGSSSASSTSVDSFGRAGKDRTASGSSVATSIDDSWSNSCSPSSIGFSSQEMSSSLLNQNQNLGLATDPSNFIFSISIDGSGGSVAQLDFDDLKLDPNDLSSGLGFDFSMPEPSGLWDGSSNMGLGMVPVASVALHSSLSQKLQSQNDMRDESQITPGQENFSSNQMLPPSLPLNRQRRSSQQIQHISIQEMASKLSDSGFDDILNGIISNAKSSSPTMNTSFSSSSNGQEASFNFTLDDCIDGLPEGFSQHDSSGSCPSSSSGSASSSSVRTPEQDLNEDLVYEFDFSMDGLGIDQAWRDAKDTLCQVENYRNQEVFAFGGEGDKRRYSGEMDVDDVIEQDRRAREIAVACA